MNYLLNTSLHHRKMSRHNTSMFTVSETKEDWSSGYSGILHCLKTELQCDNDYTMFQLRCDLRNKLDDDLFMEIFKLPLNNLSKVDVNLCSKVSTKDELSTLKTSIYVKGMEEWSYLTSVHKFDDKLCLTVLSLMYLIISCYCYFPLDFDLFIYKFDSEKKQTVVIRSHIYENSIDATNIFLIKSRKSKEN